MNREALRLYLVTNRYQDSLESFLKKVETACRSGVTIVQLREKNLTTNQYYQLAKQVKERLVLKLLAWQYLISISLLRK